jgi:hypothetical protein
MMNYQNWVRPHYSLEAQKVLLPSGHRQPIIDPEHSFNKRGMEKIQKGRLLNSHRTLTFIELLVEERTMSITEAGPTYTQYSNYVAAHPAPSHLMEYFWIALKT